MNVKVSCKYNKKCQYRTAVYYITIDKSNDTYKRSQLPSAVLEVKVKSESTCIHRCIYLSVQNLAG